MLAALLGATGIVAAPSPATAGSTLIAASGVLRVNVPEAVGGKTVVGQLAVDHAKQPGFVTAYGCDNGLPRDRRGKVTRADLNYDGRITPVWSNRLIVEADDDGDVCFFTTRPVDMVIDLNGVTFDTGISSFPNQRTDTRVGTNVAVRAGRVLRVAVPEAVGGRTVVGQLAVDHAEQPGFVTAYGCDNGLPRDRRGTITRADLNYDGEITPVWSNRLIVEADDDGDVCFYTKRRVDMIVDINGVSDTGITSFVNRRTDTRLGTNVAVGAGRVLRVAVPEAVGGKTVVGQLAVDHAEQPGFVTAYGCDNGLPRDRRGTITRADLNYDGGTAPVWSNRLIVQADDDGDVCFYTKRRVDMVIDINGVSDTGITSFPNQRIDTRTGTLPPNASLPLDANGVPQWPPYDPLPRLDGVAALTGEPVGTPVARRPILAIKIDNYRLARPQWGLDVADAIIEENVEGVTRFIALFQTRLPERIGPVRSARTGDLDLLVAMNRPIFGYSGANPGVTSWVESAARSGVLVDFTAQHNPCYSREPSRPGPHNLLLDPACVSGVVASAGPARPLWTIDATWRIPGDAAAARDTTFAVPMDGVAVNWTWDAGTGSYLRSQDGTDHMAVSGARISARNVVEIFSTYVPSPVDARSPSPITVGTGTAVVHRDGRALPATWSRATPYDAFLFFDAVTGAEIPLDRGRTFIELTRDR